jgi:Family of unknown function (DUF5995)
MPGMRWFVACAGALLAFALPASTATADDLIANWPAALPGLTEGYEPSSEDDCKSGRIRCVDAVVKEMDRRLDPLASSCDHDSMFALLYLRVTEEYRRQVGAPDAFFTDEGFVNHEDAVFARYYFEAQDAYASRPRSEVPRAWLEAFDAAAGHQVSGMGNLLLGVNAHVNRDLPYVMAAIGMVKPDGSSRKPDHDKVNEILFDAYSPAIAEAARRFDPSVSTELPLPLANALNMNSGMAAIQAWRETAWRNAERLANAPDAAARTQVERDIEAYAGNQAAAIRGATSYGPLQGSAGRDAFCAQHHDDA